MISIIICSRNPDIPKSLKENITDTIGIDYELIIIDNSNNKYSIFQAYNEGVHLSKYPYLCFMHDDILFHTQDWGKKVISHFNNPNVGLIGVAGSHYVPRLPGAHWSTGISSRQIRHTIGGKTQQDFYRYPDNKEASLQAIIIDGLWMCISNEVLKKVRFDDITFSGFHCYDSDMCLQILKANYEVRIVFDIDIEHFSLGLRNKIWLENLFIFFNKWKHELPLASIEITDQKISEANYTNAREIIEQLKINKLGYFNILKVWFNYICINPPVNRRNIKYGLSLVKRTLD